MSVRPEGSRLVELVRDALSARSPVREVAMFGGLSFLVDDAMVVSARNEHELLVRIDAAQTDQLLTVRGARPAEMGAGRTMGRGWLVVGAAGLSTHEDVDFWVGVALAHHDARAASRPSSTARKR